MNTALLVIELLVFLFSVIIHEVSHGAVAEALGDPTARLAGRITLNPLKHIDPIGTIFLPLFLVLIGSPVLFGWAKPVPYNPLNPSRQAMGSRKSSFSWANGEYPRCAHLCRPLSYCRFRGTIAGSFC